MTFSSDFNRKRKNISSPQHKANKPKPVRPSARSLAIKFHTISGFLQPNSVTSVIDTNNNIFNTLSTDSIDSIEDINNTTRNTPDEVEPDPEIDFSHQYKTNIDEAIHTSDEVELEIDLAQQYQPITKAIEDDISMQNPMSIELDNLNTSYTNNEHTPSNNTDDITPLDKFHIIVVPGDGSCFYHAIADQLDRVYKIKVNHISIRQQSNLWLLNNHDIQVLTPIENSPEFFTSPIHVTDDLTRWNSYVNKFNDTTVYADDPQIQAVAEILQLRIIIHSISRPTRIICSVTKPHDKTVYVYHTSNSKTEHFDSLKRKSSIFSKSGNLHMTPKQRSLSYNESRTSFRSPFHITTPKTNTLHQPKAQLGVQYTMETMFKHGKASSTADESDAMHTDHDDTEDIAILRTLRPSPPKPLLHHSTSHTPGITAPFSTHKVPHTQTAPPFPIAPFSTVNSINIQKDITKDALGYERIQHALDTVPTLIHTIPTRQRQYITKFEQHLQAVSQSPYLSMYISVTGIPGQTALKNPSVKVKTMRELDILVAQLGKEDLPKPHPPRYHSGIQIDWKASTHQREFRYITGTSTKTIVLKLKKSTKVAHNAVPEKKIFPILSKMQGRHRGTWSDAEIQHAIDDPTAPAPLSKRLYTFQFIHPTVDVNSLQTGTNIMVFRGNSNGPASFQTNILLSLQHSLQNDHINPNQYVVLFDRVYHEWTKPRTNEE